MKTKPTGAPAPVLLNGNELLVAKCLPSGGSAFLRGLSIAELDAIDGSLEISLLTWNGQNFAWVKPTGYELLQSVYEPMCHLTISSRTGFSKSVVYPNAQLSCLTEVYGLTTTDSCGIWRAAKMTASGRSLTALAGPSLQPEGGGVGVPWSGGSLVRGSTIISKARQGKAAFTSARLSLGGATNVVLASGLIHRIA